MIEIAMRRSGARLMPVDDHSAEDLIRVPADRDVLVKIVSQRNMKLLRFLWALAGKVADACDWLHDKDDAMDELKIRSRHVKYLVNPTTGEIRIVPKSLTKLDGAALNRLANRMVYVICRDIVPGLDESALRAEIVSMIAGPEDSNSSQAAPETKNPAAEVVPPSEAAGEIQGSSEASPADDATQAGVSSQGAGLPSGWPLLYADALRKARQQTSLAKYAAQFWAQYGGWSKVTDPADRATGAAIFDAFTANFGNPTAINDAIRELV